MTITDTLINWMGRKAPSPAGTNYTQSPLGLLEPDALTQPQFKSAFRGLVAMLLRYRAKNIAPHLLEMAVERQTGPEEWEDVEQDHRWNELLRRPCSYLAPSEFYKWLVLSYDGMGHADFIVQYARYGVLGRLPSGFLPVYPAFGRVVPLLGGQGEVKGWRFYRSDGKQYNLKAEDVLRVKRMHPSAPHRTAGLVEAAAYEIDQDLAASIYGRDSFRSQGVPDVVLEADDEIKSREVLQKVSNDFASMFGAGRKNVPVSHAGLKVKPLQLSKSDDQFMEQREFLRELLFMEFETHQGLFDANATEANATEARRGFYTNTVQPEVSAHAAKLEYELERLHESEPGQLRLSPPNVIPKDEREQAEIDKLHIESGVKSRNEVRQREGDDPYEGGDEMLVSTLMQPASSLADPL